MAGMSPGLAGLMSGGGGPTPWWKKILGGFSVGGPAGAGIGLGLSALGNIFGIKSERSRLEKLEASLEQQLKPVEAGLRQREFGPSQSEGALQQSVTRGTLSDLAGRGVLESSFAAPEVAGAVAPFEMRRQQDIRQGEQSLAAARMQIKGETSLPGYGAAFGQALGDFGELAALQAGQQEGRTRGMKRRQERIQEFLDLLDQTGG